MKATIGLEIHLALATKEKLFSRSAASFELEECSIFDSGTPGVLPVIGREPVEMAVAFGLAVGAEVRHVSRFERKHYFYPDLPLGYQITQQHEPIVIGGSVDIQGSRVAIEHAHLECDAAKSIHQGDSTYIDISRCASPLLEIVSTPCMHSASEASDYAKKIHELGIVMGICDGKLEEGSYRVDASISVSDTDKLGTRVEVKNISSFKFLEAAIDYEIARQTELIESGGSVVMETRLFQESDMSTHSMRLKETVDEYRYLMDPDIPALVIDEDFIESVAECYPVDYFEMKEALKNFGSITAHYPTWRLYYQDESLQTPKIAKIIQYWLPAGKTLTASQLRLLEPLAAKEIQVVIAQIKGSEDISHLLPKFETITVSDVREILDLYPAECAKYRAGEQKILQFLIGKCMQKFKGQVSAVMIKDLVLEYL